MRCLELGIRLLFFIPSAILATAIPHDRPQAQFWMGSNSDSREYWNLAHGPESNSTSNFVFETVNSLLQHWPNTRYRNGHTVALATVPRGTLLYHAGTSKSEVPKVPEWTAVDPEHSYLLCPSSPVQNTTSKETGCWLITLTTTRSLNLLYFDGNSAANMKGGSLDSQDLLLWGEVKEDWIFRERERINELCEWGKKYGLDGFVRMEMDFEVMLCDFTAGVKPISFLNIVSPIQGDLPPGLPPDSQISPNISKSSILETKFDRPESVRAIEAGSWANRFPGELRIKIDYSSLISFYDVDLFPSLQQSRMGKKRWDHRLEAISKEDLQAFLARLDTVLVKQDIGSGIDWKGLFNVVTNRYSERLEMLKHVLNPEFTPADSALDEESLRKAHRYVTNMLTPYRLLDVVPPKGEAENGDMITHNWAIPVFKYCATSHTEYLWLDEATLSASEKLLLTAVRGVSKEICRVLVNIWAEGEEIRAIDNEKEGELVVIDRRGSLKKKKAKMVLARWSKSVSDLVEWLDWSIWIRCRPECGYEEMCYLPTWPYFYPGIENEEEWRWPQPKCIRRLEPYDL